MPSYKVKQLQVKNFKRLIEATFEDLDDSPVVRITGDNGAGKTSVVSALWAAVAGKTAVLERGQDAASLVRIGQERAEVKVTLKSTERELKLSYSVKADGREELKVWASDGSTVGRKDLAALLSEYTIDPLKFTELDPKEQYDSVGRLVGVDVDAGRAAIKDAAEALTLAKRDAASHGPLQSQTRPASPRIDTADVRAKLSAASTQNAEAERQAQRKQSANWRSEQIDKEIEALRAKAVELKKQKEEFDAVQSEPNGTPVDVQELMSRLSLAETVNKGHEAADAADAANAKAAALAQLSAAAKESYDSAVASFKKSVQDAKMPVPGLALTEDGRLEVGGIAFNLLSTSEQILAATRIAAAANPQLKVVNVKDGSLLDEKTMALLSEMASAEGFQVFVERVGEEKDHIVIRDGAVVAQ